MAFPLVLHDKDRIARYLRRNPALHLYELGDLDDFFWPHTVWYGLAEGEFLSAVVLFYTGEDPPVLLALSEQTRPLGALLADLRPLLPACFYAHLSAGLENVFAGFYQAENHGRHHKMSLENPHALAGVPADEVEKLELRNLDELSDFYTAAYPGHWFTPRMLETGFYYGARRDGRLVCVAGVHVYSAVYRVATLGNIATHPEFRGRGLATSVTAQLCRSLLPHVDWIGLNVKAGNTPAIACYRRLGFEWAADYTEYTFTLANLP